PLAPDHSLLTCPVVSVSPYTGVLVLRGGLKNGSCRTVAAALCLIASTVTSICSLAPGCAYCGSTLAKAINCFSNGDHVVDVAFPACSRPLYTGTCTRDAVAGVCGASPILSKSASTSFQSTSSPTSTRFGPAFFSSSRARLPMKFSLS